MNKLYVLIRLEETILSWLLFLLVSSRLSSRIRTYSLLNWPKLYIPHCGGPFFWMSVYYTVFKNILTVLFDTFTTQALVSFKKYMPSPLPYFKVNIYPSPLRLNIFRLFVILSLTQLYRYTPEIFLFSTATFKYTYRAPLRRIGQEYSAKIASWKFKSLKRIQPLPVCAGFFICIRNSLDRPCVTMPHDHLLSNIK